MRRHLLLPIVICLTINCSEAPLEPTEPVDNPVLGSWIGTYTATFRYGDSEIAADTMNLMLTFFDNSRFSFGLPPDGNRPHRFLGSYSVTNDRMVFSDVWGRVFDGTYRMVLNQDSLIVTQGYPFHMLTVHEFRLERVISNSGT